MMSCLCDMSRVSIRATYLLTYHADLPASSSVNSCRSSGSTSTSSRVGAFKLMRLGFGSTSLAVKPWISGTRATRDLARRSDGISQSSSSRMTSLYKPAKSSTPSVRGPAGAIVMQTDWIKVCQCPEISTAESSWW